MAAEGIEMGHIVYWLRLGFFVLVLFNVYSPGSALADDLFDELHDGDDELKITEASKSAKPEATSWWGKWSLNLDGSLNYKYDYNSFKKVELSPQQDDGISGVSRYKVSAKVHWTARPTRWLKLHGESWFLGLLESDFYKSDKSGSTSFTELEVGEAYLLLSPLDSWDLTLGRQVVAWGEGTLLRVNDFWNPVDQREPGTLSLAEAKLPLSMVKSDFYAGPIQISLIAVAEFRGSKNPRLGSDYHPGVETYSEENMPAVSSKTAELGGKFSGTIADCRLSLYKARYYDRHLHANPKNPIILDSGISVPAGFVFSRAPVEHQGIGFSYQYQRYTLGAEAALIKGLKSFSNSTINERFDTLFSLEYNNGGDLFIGIEGVHRQLKDHLELAEDLRDLHAKDSELAFLVRKSLQRESLEFYLAAIFLGAGAVDGSLQTLRVDYGLNDNATFYAGLINYLKGERSPLAIHIDRNDQVFTGIKFYF